MRQSCSNSTAEIVRRDKQYIVMPSCSLYNLFNPASWEANRFAASQEILRILWNPKDHECNIWVYNV
jgi:hypothetical protein